MAQKVQVLLVDDLDGGEADETVTFAIDGVTYEIDLSHDKAIILRGKLQQYTNAGRRTGGRQQRRGAAPKRTQVNSNTATIRAWAKSNGYAVNDRGRIPADVQEAFNKAQAGNAEPEPAAAPEPQQAPEPQESRDEQVATKATAAKRASRRAATKKDPATVG